MGTHKINFIKSNDSWFADFTETELTPKINGVNQQHYQDLSGEWDDLLEILSEGSDNVWLTVSDSPIINGTEIKRLNKIKDKSVGYFIESYKGINLNIEFWSCSPGGFEFTFGYLPTSWYFFKHD